MNICGEVFGLQSAPESNWLAQCNIFFPSHCGSDTQCEEERKGLVVEVQKSSTSLQFLAPPQISCTVWRQWHNLSVPPFLPLWSLPGFLSLQLGKTCSDQGKQMLSCLKFEVPPLFQQDSWRQSPTCSANLPASGGWRLDQQPRLFCDAEDVNSTQLMTETVVSGR